MVDELTENHGASEVAAAALKLLSIQQKSQITAAPVKASDGPPPPSGSVRLFLTAGRRDGLQPSDLVGAIANEAGLAGNEINGLELQDECSFVEVPAEKVDHVIAGPEKHPHSRHPGPGAENASGKRIYPEGPGQTQETISPQPAVAISAERGLKPAPTGIPAAPVRIR